MTRAKKARVSRAVPAVTRAIQILRRLRHADEPMSLTEISRDLGLVSSTCLHILRVLADEGLVIFNPVTKRYRLGLGLLSFNANVLRQNPFGPTVQPVLDRLAQAFRATTFAIERSSAERLAVVAVSADMPVFTVRIIVGTSFPALASASGRCVAAHLDCPKDELEHRFRKLRWHNPPTYEEWLQQVDATRECGFGVDQGHFFQGVVIISVPISGPQGPVSRCLAAVGLSEQFTASRIREVADALIAEAAAFAIEADGTRF